MQNSKDKNENQNMTYPPVVSVLGHVDHGKTTLLDTIRKTSIASLEAGGITQKIGASQIEVTHENKKRKITFIDTPGHEAFSNMRSQGVSASDISILIVAADDGVMPQTKESIQKLLEAKIPFIVAITKIDLETANVERVKQQLLKENVLLEGYGGEVPYVPLSAKTGEKVHDLLDLIFLIYDLGHNKKSEKDEFYGVVIESKLDKKRGTLISIVVKSGIIKVGDKIFIGSREIGKVRALINTFGKNVPSGFPGDAIEIIGFKEIISVGSLIFKKAQEKQNLQNIIPIAKTYEIFDLRKLLAEKKEDKLRIVLKTETRGELEAIKNSLPQRVEVVYEGFGNISVSDVLMAKDFGAIIMGFNNSIDKDAKVLSETENVFFRIYKIIYELLDEVKDVVDDMIKQEQEVVLGKASILAGFETNGIKIIGARVNEGKISLGDKVKIMRNNKETGRSYITSLRKGKQNVKEAVKNQECGVQISPFVDFNPGDVLLSYK